ncbi:hypothetical protein PIB30_086088 [Stylosanthes scabra]|uniref:Uncharacterized protein n=1 Tax=Stylosanthes scabra TaxID=79078 RepID=A0ABU6RUB5_9FABA|nr:hypothetical protein [Stylosanthes scabra]
MLTTHEARNVGNVGPREFGATVPDIGPKRPKSLRHTHGAPSSIYSQNNMEHYGYIKRGSTPLSGTSSKPYPITCVRRTPKSLFGEALLTHTYLSHKPPTFRLGTTGYAGSPKPLEGTFRTISILDNVIVMSYKKSIITKTCS